MFDFLLDKSFLTNALTLVISGIGLLLHDHHITAIGYYALSGAFTNWLAIYMLFEKVPGLYGSGVVPNRFQEFKSGIKDLIMRQFFTAENIARFFTNAGESASLDLAPAMEKIDFDKIYESLLDAIMSSSLGGMLGMFGGPAALEPLKEPMIAKLKTTFTDMVAEPGFSESVMATLGANSPQAIESKVESIVNQRLDELTPQMVKVIVQNMIKEHLGWLVVWGGVFGGLIGLIASFIS